MARSRSTDPDGAPQPRPPRVAARIVPPTGVSVRPAANDNAAPLHLRMRRALVYAGLGVAIGWLFWAGLLR